MIIKQLLEKIRLNKLIKKYKNNLNIKINISKLPLSSDIQIDNNSNVYLDNITLNKNVSLRIRNGSTMKIGFETTFNNGCIITARKKIIIGDKCSFGPNVMIFDHDHDIYADDYRANYVCDDIIIGNNVWIGANVTILKGTIIGDNSVIAAGSIVKGEVPSNVIYYNEIIKKIKKIDNSKIKQ